MLPRFDVIGVSVHAVNPTLALDHISRWIEEGERRYVVFANVHGVTECLRDPALRSAYAGAGLVAPDGMPLVWLGRQRGQPETRRVYGPDTMLLVCERAARHGWPCFFYGGAPGV